ncbi:MAG TPA: APC family permease [Opitutaceae bacterium]|jgi:amino acid transporter|nr:APC family permease [Opitutaceae bacterium]
MSIKSIVFGREKSLSDRNLFHSISLIALFAWVGLGADGLSSSCYGPEETFKALVGNTHLSLFVALASVVTIVAICASYSQIISLFPTGGGGYLVASKLLSPATGVVSGCALLIDYVLTVTISVASGSDALFSLFPESAQHWKLLFGIVGVLGLTIINLRGVKESVMIWVPIFGVFVVTHVFVIGYALFTHASGLSGIATATSHEVHAVSASVGWFGLMALLLKSYSMGAGTYTGIEAVSNGLPILREPRVKTGRRTMVYMGVSLALTVAGLLVAYQLYDVQVNPDKTLNAVLFEKMSAGWSHATGSTFVIVTLFSEAALLIIAAQTGFLDGPRVLANMALDRWFPAQFANLSERLVTRNGVLLMGASGLVMMWATRGSVDLLVIFYSINVFITFSLSQAGMVRHWWLERRSEKAWMRKLAVNGFGLVLTASILISLTIVKFNEGGWVTILVTLVLVGAAFGVKHHYNGVRTQLRRLDTIVEAAVFEAKASPAEPAPIDHKARTAVILVNGFNGLGLHTILNVPKMFGNTFRNFIFVQVGTVDAGNFKGAADIDDLRAHTEAEGAKFVQFAKARGYGSKAYTTIGYDVPGEVMKLARTATADFPNNVFFAGQLLFTNETNMTRWLHNHTVVTLQRRFFLASMPFVVLPIRVEA